MSIDLVNQSIVSNDTVDCIKMPCRLTAMLTRWTGLLAIEPNCLPSNRIAWHPTAFIGRTDTTGASL